MKKEKKEKLLILYDFLSVKGGAEGVTLRLLDIHPDAKIAVAFVNKELFDLSSSSRIMSYLGFTSILGWQTLKSIIAFFLNRKSICSTETVIFSGNNTFVAILFGDQINRKIFYCHTPPRFVYDLKDYYISRTHYFLRPVLFIFRNLVKFIFERGIRKMDLVCANSKNVQGRLEAYLGVKSLVVYPPVDVNNYINKESEGFYLSTARLEDYKRVALIAEAFTKMPNKTLVILSGGTQYNDLVSKYGTYDNINFTGWVDSETVRDYLSRCIATIYISKDEDFGMSPVESMASGKPVIGVNEGGIKETVIDNRTGILIDADVSIDSIITAVNQLPSEVADTMGADCILRAQLFSTEIFLNRINEIVKFD
jgi:glycosyltransferase involved in cell wall biosynthesis